MYIMLMIGLVLNPEFKAVSQVVPRRALPAEIASNVI